MHDIQTATIERGNFLMLQTGAQLYTVRSYTQTIEDFTCTIQKIADIGYKAVQLSAVSKQIKPEQIREICDRAGISIVLTHSDPERILHDTDALIKRARYPRLQLYRSWLHAGQIPHQRVAFPLYFRF